MKIDEKMLSLPPYLSTAWRNVRALYVKGNLLVINLVDGDTVQIPNLPEDLIEKAFQFHALHIENEAISSQTPKSKPLFSPAPIELGGESTMRLAFGGTMDQLSGGLQHNPAQAHLPDLPKEMVAKISQIAKIMVPNSDFNLIPKGEPHCNCPFCQISRAIHGEAKETESLQIEEMVADEELQFEQWNIKQADEKLYIVTNKLDNQERYTVFLGEPVGCTCGADKCEHIVAVLKS